MFIPENVLKILSVIEKNGYEGYVVGGCVRDFLIGRTVNDYDVTTNASPYDVSRIFSDYKVIETGLKHGTVTVLSESSPIEITTYRIDGEYTNHRSPDCVSFATDINDDLCRRDFTVNAIAYNPSKGYVDPFGGREDLNLKIIRAVGNANKRFDEDALRILRAIRFASVLGFEIEKSTSDAVLNMAYLLSKISKERILAEFSKLISGKNADEIINKYSTVIDVFFPSEYRTDLKNADPDINIRFALMLFSAPSDIAANALAALKCPNSIKNTVPILLSSKDEQITNDKKVIKKMISKYGSDAFKLICKFRKSTDTDFPYDSVTDTANKIILQNECCAVSGLAISGHDLMNLGIYGEEIKNTLNEILDLVIEEKLKNDKGEIIEYIRRERK